MWKLNCGCNPIQDNSKEFIISPNQNSKFLDSKVVLPKLKEKDCELRNKIISDFYNIIDKLECGIQEDLEILLEEISILDMKSGQNSIVKKVFSTFVHDEDNYLRKTNYLSEFDDEEEKDRVLNSLGIDRIKHIILDKSDFENISSYDQNAIYFITE